MKNKRSHPATTITPLILDEMARYLIRRRPQMCWGLPSAVFQLVRHLAAYYNSSIPNISHVKLGGEQIYHFQRQEIQNRLGARVFATYGCTEVGVVAAECKLGSLHVFSENVHLEVIKDGRRVAPGEKGDLVATTLANRAMPLIRCRIGDQGSISPEGCRCGLPHPVLLDLRAKAMDMMETTSGKHIPAFHLSLALHQLFSTTPPRALRQVLFMQKERLSWKIYVESMEEVTQELSAKLIGIIHNLMGAGSHIEIQRVSFIPRERSGKFRYFSRSSPRFEQEVSPATVSEPSPWPLQAGQHTLN